MAISDQVDFFLNFQQFGDLKLLARKHSGNAAQVVAQQFEGLFLQQMLSAMRAAAKVDSGQHSSYLDFYQEMYDKQLAQIIAKQDNLGIAKIIMQQLPTRETEPGDEPASVALDASGIEPGITVNAFDLRPEATHRTESAVSNESSSVVLNKIVEDDFAEVAHIEQTNTSWRNPTTFVADIWPQVQSAAQDLGVSARLLVAQAALETGWGKHTLKFDDGRSSYNLFGIKAGPQWRGDTLSKVSPEYRDGLLRNQVSKFRVYASPAQSLSDYVDFIRSNPRYQQALKLAGNDQAYIREIHNAGYATDPDYANKVIEILRGEVLHDALASLNPGVSDNA